MAEPAGHHREPVPDEDNAWFFNETTLDELLTDAQTLRSIEDLAIDDLAAEEAESFLRAIKE